MDFPESATAAASKRNQDQSAGRPLSGGQFLAGMRGENVLENVAIAADSQARVHEREATSATTSEPMMGLFLVRTSDIRTLGMTDRSACFHFLGVHLQAPDINDSIAPAAEVVALVSQIEGMLRRVDKTVRILKWAMYFIQVPPRCARRANAKRVIHDFKLNAGVRSRTLQGNPVIPSLTSKATTAAMLSDGKLACTERRI